MVTFTGSDPIKIGRKKAVVCSWTGWFLQTEKLIDNYRLIR